MHEDCKSGSQMIHGRTTKDNMRRNVLSSSGCISELNILFTSTWYTHLNWLLFCRSCPARGSFAWKPDNGFEVLIKWRTDRHTDWSQYISFQGTWFLHISWMKALISIFGVLEGTVLRPQELSGAWHFFYSSWFSLISVGKVVFSSCWPHFAPLIYLVFCLYFSRWLKNASKFRLYWSFRYTHFKATYPNENPKVSWLQGLQLTYSLSL